MALIRATDKKVGAEILVVGFTRTTGAKSTKPKFEIESGDMAIDRAGLVDALVDMGATGAADEVIKLPASGYKLLVLTGLGDKSSSGIYSHESLRRASGAAARSLHGQVNATFSLPYDSLEGIAAIAEGALLGAYTFDEFRGSSKAERKPALKSIEIFTVKAKNKEVAAL
ncbi:MAG: leucyl aminopeptidase, partial [Actinobacteria bacterium]|nr:leucyl aminopeptidase [Actinomycetota bacterium]